MRQRLSTVAALAAVFACSGPETGELDAGTEDAGGPPDRCTDEAPCRLESGVRESEYLYPVGDSDRFVFEVPRAGQVIHVLLTHEADVSPVRLEMALMGPDGMAMANRRQQSAGRQRLELQVVARVPGTHAVLVRDVGNDHADRLAPYFITVTLREETDQNEPNDSAAAATALSPGVAAFGTIGFQGDEDWFALEVGEGQLLEIELVAPAGSSPVRFRWELFAPDGTTRIAQSTEPPGGAPWPVESRSVGNVAGRYLVRVSDAPEDGAAADLERVYQLTVRLVAEPDPHDLAAPNESHQTATRIAAGQTVTGYIASTSDADYYAFEVPGATAQRPRLVVVRAEMEGRSPVDLSFTVLGRDGRTPICEQRDGDLCKALRFVRDGEAAPARLSTAHVATAAGTHYVVVRDLQDNDFDRTTPYRLTVELPDEPDPNETYGTGNRTTAVPVLAATATTGLVIGYPWVEGHISHANDQDWYRFDFPGPVEASPGQNGDWRVQVELELPGPTPVELELFFYGEQGSPRPSYQGYGRGCRRNDNPADPEPCQWPDETNGIRETFGEVSNQCFVIFREVTRAGPHYFRVTDLDRDDFDLSANGRYRFRVTITAGCPVPGVCEGVFRNPQTQADLCGRP